MKGFLAVVPVLLTLWILYKLVSILDGIFIGILKPLGLYFPGVGVILVVIFLPVIGILASGWITGSLFNLLERIFEKVPIVKSIYSIVKDTISSFMDTKKGFSKLCIINLPGSEMKLLGFITNENLTKFGDELESYVSVYLMQSMQWAGNLVLVPKSWVKVLDVSAEESIKFIASAGLIEGNKGDSKSLLIEDKAEH